MDLRAPQPHHQPATSIDRPTAPRGWMGGGKAQPEAEQGPPPATLQPQLAALPTAARCRWAEAIARLRTPRLLWLRRGKMLPPAATSEVPSTPRKPRGHVTSGGGGSTSLGPLRRVRTCSKGLSSTPQGHPVEDSPPGACAGCPPHECRGCAQRDRAGQSCYVTSRSMS